MPWENGSDPTEPEGEGGGSAPSSSTLTVYTVHVTVISRNLNRRVYFFPTCLTITCSG